MKTILIPTDFSVTARNAFIYAVKLFGSSNKFILLNSYEEPRTTSASMISLRDVLHEGSVEALEEEMVELKSHLGENMPEVETISHYGDSIHSILQVARMKKAFIIVMGTTGATGLKEVVMGSVAAGVIQDALCPVLAIPNEYTYQPPRNILLASDLQSSIDADHLNVLTTIVELVSGKITVVTVEDDDDISMEEVEQGFKMHEQLVAINHEFDLIKEEDVELALANYARVNDMDMIVTIPRKSNWFQRLLNPSISRKLAQHQQRPVLALTR